MYFCYSPESFPTAIGKIFLASNSSINFEILEIGIKNEQIYRAHELMMIIRINFWRYISKSSTDNNIFDRKCEYVILLTSLIQNISYHICIKTLMNINKNLIIRVEIIYNNYHTIAISVVATGSNAVLNVTRRHHLPSIISRNEIIPNWESKLKLGTSSPTSSISIILFCCVLFCYVVRIDLISWWQ